MRITLFMAMSLNGLIARPDYREDFLSIDNWNSFLDCARESGAIVWGRKTQEKFQRLNRAYFDDLQHLARVAVSTDPDFRPAEGFERAASPADAVSKLEARGFERATLAGGSILNASFAREGLIDDVVINIEAVVVGRGIPLFATETFDVRLEFDDIRSVSRRIVQLRGHVRRES